MRIEFIKSATEPQGYPKSTKPEVALAGRSNAGKSSFINALAGRSVAKVSQTPGKTRLLNFFTAGDHYSLVDMPGYGYASRSGDEVRDWQKFIEDYIAGREQLVGLLLIMDIRRDWSDDEEMLVDFMNSIDKPVAILLNKADQLKSHEVTKRQLSIAVRSDCANIFTMSTITRAGIKEIEEFVFRQWVCEP